MSAVTTGSSIEQQCKKLLRTNLAAFNERCFAELNPGQVFVRSYHFEAVAYQLERTIAGDNTRFMASLPPRSGKTGLISLAFPAFVLGLDPSKRIIFTTYAADLAEETTRSFQRIIASEWYRNLFPGMRPTMNTLSELKTDANGGRLALGMAGSLTGRGADIIIVDDIMKANDTPSATIRASVQRFFNETLYSRLNSKEHGSIIISQQRLHQDDLIGGELEKGGWNHINFPSIATEDESIPLGRGKFHQRRKGDLLSPGRESAASLEETRRHMGSAVFQAQYQGQPTPADGLMIKKDWLQAWTRLPSREGSRIIMSLDTAGNGNPKSDYSACSVWWEFENKHYLVDVLRERLDFTELRATMILLHDRHRPDLILIENKVLGSGLIDDLRKNWHYTVAPIDPKGDKQGRLSLVQGFFEGKQVYLPAEDTPWREAYLAELLAFPGGRHDDQVDSTTQYLNHVRTRGEGFRHEQLFDWRDPENGTFYDPMDHAAILASPRR